MSGDDGRIPVTMYVRANVTDPELVQLETADGKWVNSFSRAGAAERGIALPPSPPVKVTLSIELDEADVLELATRRDYEQRVGLPERALNATFAAARAWGAANPEGEKP